jgi:hypothetical protein
MASYKISEHELKQLGLPPYVSSTRKTRSSKPEPSQPIGNESVPEQVRPKLKKGPRAEQKANSQAAQPQPQPLRPELLKAKQKLEGKLITSFDTGSSITNKHILKALKISYLDSYFVGFIAVQGVA